MCSKAKPGTHLGDAHQTKTEKQRRALTGKEGVIMTWLDKLERRFGRYSIHNLITIVVLGQALVWFLIMFVYSPLMNLLPLDRSGLLHGQIWRLVTFIFMPTLTISPFYLLLELYFRWWVGMSLTRAWGDFRFCVYFVVGMLGAIASCLLVGSSDTSGLFLSLFFAYAWMWPEQRVLLMFFIPLKIKWLGWAAAILWALEFLFGSLADKVSLLFGLAGFLAFFGPEIWHWARDTVVSYRRRREWQNRNR